MTETDGFECAMENLISAARQVEFALHFADGGEQANANLELDKAREALMRAASGMEAFGRDGETRLRAKHESPTAESGDAQTQSGHHPKGNN